MPMELLANCVRGVPGLHAFQQLVAGGNDLRTLASVGHFPKGRLAFGAKAEVLLGVEGAGHKGKAAIVRCSAAKNRFQRSRQPVIRFAANALSRLDHGKNGVGERTGSQVVQATFGAVRHHDESGDIAQAALDQPHGGKRPARGGKGGGVGKFTIFGVASHHHLARLDVANDTISQVANNELVMSAETVAHATQAQLREFALFHDKVRMPHEFKIIFQSYLTNPQQSPI